MGGTRKRTTNERELGGEARGAEGIEKSQGGNELKKRRLGASDFGNAALEWEKRIRERANDDNLMGSGPMTTTRDLGSGGSNVMPNASKEEERRGFEGSGGRRSESQLGAGRGERASSIGAGGGGGNASGSRIQDLEERRRFWRERVRESVSNAKNVRLLLSLSTCSAC